jgi:hypothetical protein
MSSLYHNHNKRIWRTAFLVLLVVALSGPWFFDRIHVPSQYACSAPHIRLDEYFCGTPLTFAWLLGELTRTVISLVRGALSGGVPPVPLLSVSIPVLLTTLLVLPLVSSWLLIVRNDQRRWRRFHLVALALAAGAVALALVLTGLAVGLSGLTGGLTGLAGPYRALWGLWLYVAVIAGMLLWEVLVSKRRQKAASLREAT